MLRLTSLPGYDRSQTYQWNYDHAPEPVAIDAADVPGSWQFCGLPVASPLGMPAGPLLSGRWCLYYASLGFDVLTYKTVRSRERACYPLPNLQPVECSQLHGGETDLPAVETMHGSWAVSYGMPSKTPDVWRADIEETRRRLPAGKLLSVSVVGTVQEGWTIDDLADDYAQCAKWAVESGADCVETNFSCPNVSTCDGQLYQQPADAATVAARVRQAIGRTPYIAKIGRIVERKEAAALLDAIGTTVDALAMTNSIAATVRAADNTLLFNGQQRGICGDATREASVEQTRMISQLIQQRGLNVQLIGVGGASTAQHVREYLNAGAHAIHIATAAMVNPAVALEIRKLLAEYTARGPEWHNSH
jgi:dihydroorotate dehydrogenase (NAD+) catalytic subunit